MFIPYKDENPVKKFPIVTYFLIFVTVAVFFVQYFSTYGFEYYSRQFALIPAELFRGNLPDSDLVPPFLTLVTYLFEHGGIKHLVFNMLFMWIFGNNIEDVMTRWGFLVFYLLTGMISALAFVVFNPMSEISLVGASGSISAVLGVYLFVFPLARVRALFFIIPVRMPAFIFIVIWFFSQVSGFLGGGGDIAWISHIAGFVSGIFLYPYFLRRKK